jgi:methionyl-tRNA formyltransferase
LSPTGRALTDAKPLRVIFAGTPEFARVALQALAEAGHIIVLVLTQPDRPAGRGMKLHASAVKQFALDHHIPVSQPRSLRLDGKFPDDAAQARAAIEAAQADVMVVAAYGLILPQWVLSDMAAAATRRPKQGTAPSGGSAVPAVTSVGAKFGCLNIHASLLPRWRGAAPIHRAIEAGDLQTGITIMQMDAGLDTGDMLLVETFPIAATDSTGALHDKLAALGGRMIVQALELATQGALTATKQASEGITYAHKVEKHEALVDWNQTADVIVRRILAFNPFPGAHSVLAGEAVKIWNAVALPEMPPQGSKNGSLIATSRMQQAWAAINSIVEITELQRAGGKRMAVDDFLRGMDTKPGLCFGDNANQANLQNLPQNSAQSPPQKNPQNPAGENS